MGTQLMKLRNVPDDEAHEIRALLHENDIDFYETSPGLLGFSTPAIWLKEPEQLDQAKQLLQTYQEQRCRQARESYAQQIASGQQRTFASMAKENPIRFLGYLALIALILYFSIKPFITLSTSEPPDQNSSLQNKTNG